MRPSRLEHPAVFLLATLLGAGAVCLAHVGHAGGGWPPTFKFAVSLALMAVCVGPRPSYRPRLRTWVAAAIGAMGFIACSVVAPVFREVEPVVPVGCSFAWAIFVSGSPEAPMAVLFVSAMLLGVLALVSPLRRAPALRNAATAMWLVGTGSLAAWCAAIRVPHALHCASSSDRIANGSCAPFGENAEWVQCLLPLPLGRAPEVLGLLVAAGGVAFGIHAAVLDGRRRRWLDAVSRGAVEGVRLGLAEDEQTLEIAVSVGRYREGADWRRVMSWPALALRNRSTAHRLLCLQNDCADLPALWRARR
ncbi:hypothetical protein [Pendulispora albinea]|uniref:Uncharacterized protein n=1 Tax=Pendulispora albinea TaxID=2741071 RepID=A0ABZ2M5H2_9BACT